MIPTVVLRGVALGLALSLVGCAAEDAGAPEGSTPENGTSQSGGTETSVPTPTPTPAPGGATVAASLSEDLQFLREEEKLARDVYLTLYDQWQLMPHKNIASSEQTHTDRVKAMLTSLTVADPVADDTVGAFVNAELGKLYTDLVATGKQSEVASLEVGATIEDLDIRDIEQMKGRTTDANVLAMYESLQCGSRNHLRAYTSQLTTRGVTYTPKYITAADYSAIVNGSSEKCGQ